MKTIIKKIFTTYLVIICCIYTPTAQAAWSFSGFNFGNSSLNIVKDGVKITTAPVNTAPITSNLAKRIASSAVRGVNILTVISVISGLASDAIDWVLDPANNSIKYKAKVPLPYDIYFDGAKRYYSTGAAACSALLAYIKKSDPTYTGGATYKATGTSGCYNSSGGLLSLVNYDPAATQYNSVPIPDVSREIFNNAKAGDVNAQADVMSAVQDAVNVGTYDKDIEQAIANPDNPDNPTQEIDLSSITSAISSLASALSAQMQAITSVINSSIDSLLNKQEQMQGELVNVGSKVDSLGGQVVGVGDKVDNVGGKVVGVGDAVKDVGGKVVGLNDSVDKVGDAVVGVGDKVTAGTDAVGTKVDAVGDKVTGVGADVRGVGDKVTASTDAVGTKVDAVGDKVTDAINEQTKEITKKMDETKPNDFELPAFCSWASKVCDFIDWVKKDPELPPDDNTPLVKDDKDSSFVDEYANKSYVNFSGQCPAPPVFNIFGGQITFPMEIVCKACEQMSWVFISFAWLRAVMIVFFASKG